MIRSTDLPLLPGNSFQNNAGKTRFHKSHHFEYCNDIPVITEKVKPGIGGMPYPGTRPAMYPSVYARGESVELPPWLAFDKQVLQFDAYFQESVQEKYGYNHNVRKCKIFFYLEDGTVQVREPAVMNSGIPQGTLIGRQRIPFPAPRHDEFYDILDFNIGKEVELYGRVFKITNCDKFTRVFLNRLGISVSDPVDAPEDPYTSKQKMSESVQTKKSSRAVDTRGQFLAFDKKVLKFYGIWDDREHPHGFLHKLEIYYYLADDTIQIKEIIPPNSGRDSGFMFLRRAKLPKSYTSLPHFGWDSQFTVLNVLSTGFVEGRYIPDPLNCGRQDIEYYEDSDMSIGAAINVYGRKVIITDMDQFTKEYYRAKYGIDDFTPISYPEQSEEKCLPKLTQTELPPHNGFGSFEDSAANCKNIIPVPPTRDFTKFYNKDRQGIDGYILRFRAKLISRWPGDEDRIFVLSFYLSDDTIQVAECVRGDTESQSKKFFSRNRVTKPGQDKFSSHSPEYYGQNDLYIGNSVNVNGFKFLLTDADEYTLRYMELNSYEFPKSNIHLILNKVKDALRPVYKEFVRDHLDSYECGMIPFRIIKETLKRIMCDGITDQEIVTLGRHYNMSDDTETYTLPVLRSIVHTELKRFLFDSLDRMTENMNYADVDHTGYLPRETVYALCRGSQLPIDKEVLNAVLDKIEKNADGKINYKQVLDFFDVKKTTAPSSFPVNIKGGRFLVYSGQLLVNVDHSIFKYEISSAPHPISSAVISMDYKRFIKDLDLESTITNQSG